MTGRLATMIGGGALLAACVPDGQWFTPAGVALGEIDCIGPAPLEGGWGREICLTRLIGNSAEELARCNSEGGRPGPVSPVDARLACSYPRPGKAAE